MKFNILTGLVLTGMICLFVLYMSVFRAYACNDTPNTGTDHCGDGESGINKGSCLQKGACSSTVINNPIACKASEWFEDDCQDTTNYVTQTTTSYSGNCAWNSAYKICVCDNSTFISSTTDTNTLKQAGECLVAKANPNHEAYAMLVSNKR